MINLAGEPKMSLPILNGVQTYSLVCVGLSQNGFHATEFASMKISFNICSNVVKVTTKA